MITTLGRRGSVMLRREQAGEPSHDVAKELKEVLAGLDKELLANQAAKADLEVCLSRTGLSIRYGTV